MLPRFIQLSFMTEDVFLKFAKVSPTKSVVTVGACSFVSYFKSQIHARKPLESERSLRISKQLSQNLKQSELLQAHRRKNKFH